MTTITIDAKEILGEISPTIRGSTVVFEPVGAHHLWDWENDQPDPLLVKRSKEIGLGVLDFPAGSMEDYHWTKGIGPRKLRGKNVGGEWIMSMSNIPKEYPVNNDFGTDEFCRFIEAVGCDGKIIVNFGTGTPEEAAAWVAYINGSPGDSRPIGIDILGIDWKTVGYWADLRVTNGHSAPYNIEYWEVGCEIYGDWPKSWTSILPEKERAYHYFYGAEKGVWQKDVVPNKILDNVSRVRTENNWSLEASKSDGKPNQKKWILFPPVGNVKKSPVLTIDNCQWKMVDDLSICDCDAKVYEFDFKTGEIKFGDNIHGMIPPSGSMIKVTYLSGPQSGFIHFSEKMKYVDPEIKISSAIWDTDFIDVLKVHADYVTIKHKYYTQPFREGGYEHEKLIVEADSIGNELIRTKEKLNNSGVSSVAVGLTEYNAHERESKFTMSLVVAIWVASILKYAAEIGSVTVNLWEFVPKYAGDSSKQGFKYWHIFDAKQTGYIIRPRGYVYQLFSKHFGDKTVRTIVDSSQKFKFEKEEYPCILALSSRSTQDEKKLYLIVINRDKTRDVTADIRINQFPVQPEAIVWTLNGPSTLSYNDVDHPEEVCIKDSKISNVTENFEYTFPAHSVNVIEFFA